jgi:hypothetical protein
MNQMHEKLSVWARLHKQLAEMESGWRSTSTQAIHGMGADLSAMEVELKALRAKVDTAFNIASAAIHDQSRMRREGPTVARSRESERQGPAERGR